MNTPEDSKADNTKARTLAGRSGKGERKRGNNLVIQGKGRRQRP